MGKTTRQKAMNEIHFYISEFSSTIVKPYNYGGNTRGQYEILRKLYFNVIIFRLQKAFKTFFD